MPASPIYNLKVSEVFEALETSHEGLNTEDAKHRQSLYGRNLVKVKKTQPAWQGIFLYTLRFHSLLMYMAGIVAWLAGDTILAIMIWLAELGNTAFGFWREYRAGQAVEKLEELLPAVAHIRRNGQDQHLPASELVPGDLLILAEGDNIPADARIVEEFGFRVNNSALTGEAMPVYKNADASISHGISEIERHNLVFAGTSIAAGTGKAVVYATGMLTQFGRIARLTQTIEDEPTRLQREIKTLTRNLTIGAFIIGGGLALADWLDPAISYAFNPNPLLLAIGIIVSVIPEGLPATLTLSLAAATQRLANQHVLIKKLATVEVLGGVSVICTDKSGTLTENQMTVREIWVAHQQIKVTGSGYEPKGDFNPTFLAPEFQEDLLALLEAAACCNNARILPPNAEHRKWSGLGDQTEAALKVAAMKAGLNDKKLEATYPRVHEIPFDARRKRMSTIHRTNFHETAFVKGAPREVLQLCTHIQVGGQIVPLTNSLRAEIIDANDTYSRRALRVLAIARRELPKITGAYTAETVEQDLIFLGLMAMMDPPRPQVEAAIQALQRAGIRTIMITGDYGLTAESVARRIGLVTTANPRIITGAELEVMKDDELLPLLENEVIFARMAPEHKMHLVAAFQARGEVVAVTGDGVNDAPALRKANVGIAMGLAGTDVAKEAADVILTDDNFLGLVTAIEEGRTIFENIRKFMTYILSSNVAEVLPFLISGLFPIPQAITARQAMAVDMGTDMLPALSLGIEPPETEIMNHPPRRGHQPLLDNALLTRSLLWLGLLETGLCYLAFFGVYLFSGNADHIRGLSILLALPWPEFLFIPIEPQSVHITAITTYHVGVVMAQIGNAFACRVTYSHNSKVGWLTNRYLLLGILAELAIIMSIAYIEPFQTVFEHTNLPGSAWLVLAFIPIGLYGLEWIRKAIWQSRKM